MNTRQYLAVNLPARHEAKRITRHPLYTSLQIRAKAETDAHNVTRKLLASASQRLATALEAVRDLTAQLAATKGA